MESMTELKERTKKSTQPPVIYRTPIASNIADEETDQTLQLDEKRTLGRHLLSTQEWLQLARLA